MNEEKLISVITPVYNGAQFLDAAYACLNRQSYTKWEWVVVDDGSTDETPAVLRRIAAGDRRVSVFTQAVGSGSAKLPRDRAAYESHGELLLPLDADDLLADDYLELMLRRMAETEADIVYPHMTFIDMASGQVTEQLPREGFDTTQVYTGRELIRATMPDWTIGCNGGLYRRSIWSELSYPVKSEPIWMNSDEVDERLFLLKARRVAFSSADYSYVNHAEAITVRITPKLLHPLKTNAQLLALIAREFGKDSEEWHLMNLKAFYNWRYCLRLYCTGWHQMSGADAQLHRSLKDAFSQIDAAELSQTDRIRFFGLKHFQLVFAIFCLKYAPGLLARKVLQRMAPHFYLWHVRRREEERAVREKVMAIYGDAAEATPCKPCVVCMHCNTQIGGGLVDRLRGAVSTYEACRETGADFRLFFSHPFMLEDYLEPAQYDWRISETELCLDNRRTDVFVSYAQSDTDRERSLQHQQMTKAIKGAVGRQVHVYTNAAFCYQDGSFARLFAELFRPSARLQARLDAVKEDIGAPYITVSARFCNLLDDFNEEVYSEPLPLNAQERLLEACMEQIADLHALHPAERIVVCSDSRKLTARARQSGFAYCIEGIVSHIGNDTVHDYAYYEKTFLDFFIISQAQETYLLKGPGMMGSGFPYAASLIGRKTLRTIEFQI